MNGHDERAYGAAVGSEYDVLYPASAPEFQTEAAVALLSELASDGGSQGRILEFGIGTGRLAIPLSRRGFGVVGIDGSAEILQQLQAKRGAEDLHVVRGDFINTEVPGLFSLVVLAVNTIFAPSSRAAQIECFRNAARHLSSDGRFVVEAYLLRPEQLSGAWSIWPRLVGSERVEMQVARYDLASNHVERTLIHLRPEGTRLIQVNDCYAWPGELDLMAQLAGFELEDRYGDWTKKAFSNSCDRHVSIYRLRNAST